jgi:hypothetical protein
MPNRGSQSVRETHYKWLVRNYGERCIICGKAPPPGQKLQIDEISYAPEHFDEPDNLSLVCAADNCFLRGQPEEVHRRIIENHRAKRLKELSLDRARDKSLGSALDKGEGGRSAIANRGGGEEGRLARQLKRIRKKTGIDTPLPDDSFKRDVLDYFNGSSEMKANAKYYPAFAMVVWQTLIERGPTGEDDILDIGALLTKANQTTLKRYLRGWYAPHKSAPLARTDTGGDWTISFKDPSAAFRINQARAYQLGVNPSTALGKARDKKLGVKEE